MLGFRIFFESFVLRKTHTPGLEIQLEGEGRVERFFGFKVSLFDARVWM